MCFLNKYLGIFLILVSTSIVGQKALSQSAIPEDKCAIITGATKDPKVALRAIEKFKDFGNPVVIQSSNGYLAPSIGIYYKDYSKELVEDFKKDKIIPDDSYCGNADRFVSILYPNKDFSALTTNPPSLIAQRGYVGMWSADPNDCITDTIYFDDNSATFSNNGDPMFCPIHGEVISPVNSSYLTIYMICYEDDTDAKLNLSLTFPYDTFSVLDWDKEFTKCSQ